MAKKRAVKKSPKTSARTTKKTSKASWQAKRFAKTKFAITGNFPYSCDRGDVKKLVEREGGEILKIVNADCNYLVVGETRATGPSGAEKKAAQLNQKGATIAVISVDELQALVWPTREEALAMLKGGEDGRSRFNWLTGGYGSYGYRPTQGTFDLNGENLRKLNLNGFYLGCVDLNGADLRETSLINTDLSDDEIVGARFDAANMEGTHLPAMNGCSLKKTNLKECYISTKLEQCDFSGANMENASGYDVQTKNCQFKKAILKNASFEESKFTGADFSGANLSSSNFAKSELNGADFSGADLQGADLSSAKLLGANLSKTKLQGANLAGADLTDAIIDGADFRGAHIGGTKFDNVDTGKAKNLDVSQAAAVGSAGPNVKKLASTAKKARRLETSATVQLATGPARLSLTSYGSGYTSSNAQLGDNTDYGWGKSFTQSMLDMTTRYGGGELLFDSITVSASKSPIKGKELKALAVAAWCEACGVEPLTEEELAEKEQQTKALQAERREVYGRLLSGGSKGVKAWNDLSVKDRLSAGHFRNTDLSGAKLRGITLEGLDFQGSDFSGATLAKANLGGDFKKCIFAGADMKDASLSGGKYQDADFSGANLSKGSLRASSFRRAKFNDAKLDGVDLSYADLTGADVSTVDFSKVKVDRTQYDDTTLLPKQFVHSEGMDWKGPGQPPGLVEALKAARPSGPIDMETFMENIKRLVEKSRLDKALKMLKADRFELFADVQDDHLVGVVKSQTDATLVYSCRLASDGSFACCTQNLNPCGGLRGKPCKHLLVLVIGLTQAEKVDPTTVDEWVDASRLNSPQLDKDIMSETLLRYKGAEAGEVDWRPTETVPEDYYAF